MLYDGTPSKGPPTFFSSLHDKSSHILLVATMYMLVLMMLIACLFFIGLLVYYWEVPVIQRLARPTTRRAYQFLSDYFNQLSFHLSGYVSRPQARITRICERLLYAWFISSLSLRRSVYQALRFSRVLLHNRLYDNGNSGVCLCWFPFQNMVHRRNCDGEGRLHLFGSCVHHNTWGTWRPSLSPFLVFDEDACWTFSGGLDFSYISMDTP